MILSFHPVIRANKNLSVAGQKALPKEYLQAIKASDAVILPQIAPKFLYEAVMEFNKPCFPDQALRFKWKDKSSQIHSFLHWGITFPKTELFEDVGALLLGGVSIDYPFVIKSASEHEGRGVVLVKGEEDLLAIRLDPPKCLLSGPILAQEFINGQGYVLRVVCLYKDQVAYWKWAESEIVSIAKRAKVIRDFRKDLIQKGIETTIALREKVRLDVAAIDMIYDMTNPEMPYWLEVNFFFGRKGLGGSRKYYGLLLKATKCWLRDVGLNPEVSLWV